MGAETALLAPGIFPVTVRHLHRLPDSLRGKHQSRDQLLNRIGALQTSLDIRKLPMFIPTTSGLDMIRVVTMPDSIWIIPGSTAGLRVALDRVTFFTLAEGVRSVLDLTASSLALPDRI